MPLSSTLFPYTTLFRSSSPNLDEFNADAKPIWRPQTNLSHQHSTHSKLPTNDSRIEFLLRLDRKSTRLNSSHSQISYAVLCLKKKIFIPSSAHSPSRA